MKRWIGRWIIGVGVIHCGFGAVVFSSTWRTLLSEGLFNTVNGQAEREFPFWFFAFGLLAILLGAAIDHLEQLGLPLPAFLAWGLLALNVIFLVVMPISGGWLLVPAVIGGLRSARSAGG
jgi:hypothetical protein